MCIGFASEDKQQCDDLALKGHQHVVCTDGTQSDDHCYTTPDMHNIFHVENVLDGDDDTLKLKSYNLTCSCFKCRQGLSCPYHLIRNGVSHNLRMRDTHDAMSDEEVTLFNTKKLTIHKLKVELKSRGTSTSHKVKNELVDYVFSQRTQENN